MDDIGEWRQLSTAEAFRPEDQEGVAVYAVTVDVSDPSGLASRLVLDPLPLLIENIDWVDEGWTVTVNRVNADISLAAGPHHLMVIWVVIRKLLTVHGTAYRVSPPAV
jgi:hypothetical protein